MVRFAERAHSHPERQAGLDPTLSVVRTAYRQFEATTSEVANLKELSLEQAVSLANRAGIRIAERLGFYDPQRSDEENGKWRAVTVDGARALATAVGTTDIGPGARYLAFRHGTQQASPIEQAQEFLRIAVETEGDAGRKEALKKVLGMVFPQNRQETTKTVSLVEATEFGVILKWIQATSGKKLVIRSSEFYRALQPALVLEAVTGSRITTDPRLNSLGYRTPADEIELTQMLQDLPTGAIPLDRDLINKWGQLDPPAGSLSCDRGIDPTDIYAVLENREKTAMDEAMRKQNANVFTLDIEHTQHHIFAGLRGDTDFDRKLRLTELGGIVLQKRWRTGENGLDYDPPTVLKGGIFAEKPTAPSIEESNQEALIEDRLAMAQLIIDAGQAVTPRFRRRLPTPLSPIGTWTEKYPDQQNSQFAVFPNEAISLPLRFGIKPIGRTWNRMGPYVDGQLVERAEDLVMLAPELELNPLRWLHAMQIEGATIPLTIVNRAENIYAQILKHRGISPESLSNGIFDSYAALIFNREQRGQIIRIISHSEHTTTKTVEDILTVLQTDPRFANLDASLKHRRLRDVTITKEGEVLVHTDGPTLTIHRFRNRDRVSPIGRIELPEPPAA